MTLDLKPVLESKLDLQPLESDMSDIPIEDAILAPTPQIDPDTEARAIEQLGQRAALAGLENDPVGATIGAEYAAREADFLQRYPQHAFSRKRQQAEVRSAEQAATRVEPRSGLGAALESPTRFIDRMGFNALPMAGALAGARLLTVRGLQPLAQNAPLIEKVGRGLTHAAPIGGMVAGGGLAGLAQEKLMSAAETPEETQARHEEQARLGETTEGKLADLATMGLIARPSISGMERALAGDAAAMQNIGLGAGLGGGLATANAAMEGRLPSSKELATGFTEGALFSTPTKLGARLMGHGPEGSPKVTAEQARQDLQKVMMGEPIPEVDRMPIISANKTIAESGLDKPLTREQAFVAATQGLDAVRTAPPESGTLEAGYREAGAEPILTPESVSKHRVETAKREIEEGIKSGDIPETVRSFEELHKYVDANEYVNDAERSDRLIGPLGKKLGWGQEDYIEFTNSMTGQLDEWLKSGRKPSLEQIRQQEAVPPDPNRQLGPQVDPQLRGEASPEFRAAVEADPRKAAIAKEVDNPILRPDPLPEFPTGARTLPDPAAPEGGAFGGKGGKRPTVTPVGSPPSGARDWLKIQPARKRILSGLEREGASAILQTRQKNPIGRALGKATDKQFDAEAELMGRMWKKVDDSTRGLSKRQQEAAFDELATFTREKENGRTPLPLGPNAQKLQTAWEDIAEFTGMLSQARGVKVMGDSGYRPMKPIGRSYVPRAYAPEFTKAIRDPNSYPAEFNKYADDLAVHWGITPDEAAKTLNDMAGGKGRLAANDFMGNIEIARGEKLPESFYDYDMRRVMSNYINGYARRMGQIIAYGQRLEGPAGPVQKNLWDLARDEVQGGDRTTAEWLNEAEAQSTNERVLTGFGRMGQRLQTLATGLLLANPTSTVPRNLLSGVTNSAELLGARRTIAAGAKAMTSAQARLDAREAGVVRDNMATLLHADQLSEDAALRKFTDALLTGSGYNASERFVRTTNFLAGASFAEEAARLIKSNPNGRKTRQMAAQIERMGVKPDDIAAEGGDWKTGPRTRQFIRQIVNQQQGGYRFNQVPLWAGSPVGRFFYQFGRWGTQRAQNLWNNVVKPAMVGSESTVNGVKMSVRDMKPLVRMALGTLALGESYALLSQGLLGRDRKDASLTEITQAATEDKTKAVELAASRAINDLVMSGSLGIWGQPVDLARATQAQSRFKNPIEPPGGSGLRALVQLGTNVFDQGGEITRDDLKDFGQAFVPGAVATADVVRNAFDEPKFEAENDQRTLRMAGMRFADAGGLDINRGSKGVSRKSPNTPEFTAVRDALLVGDVAKALKLKQAFIANAEDRAAAEKALRQSVVGRQPFRVGPYTNEEVKKDFYAWAQKNLSASDLDQVKRVQARYENAAKAAHLWKTE